MAGTDMGFAPAPWLLGYAATRFDALDPDALATLQAMSSTERSYAATPLLCDVRQAVPILAMLLLRVYQAMSGTEIGYAATPFFAFSGTETSCGATATAFFARPWLCDIRY
eukprot:3464407-Rhodomonas_salina.4